MAARVGTRTTRNRVAELRARRSVVNTGGSPADDGRLRLRARRRRDGDRTTASRPLELMQREIEAEEEQRETGPEQCEPQQLPFPPAEAHPAAEPLGHHPRAAGEGPSG